MPSDLSSNLPKHVKKKIKLLRTPGRTKDKEVFVWCLKANRLMFLPLSGSSAVSAGCFASILFSFQWFLQNMWLFSNVPLRLVEAEPLLPVCAFIVVFLLDCSKAEFCYDWLNSQQIFTFLLSSTLSWGLNQRCPNSSRGLLAAGVHQLSDHLEDQVAEGIVFRVIALFPSH